MLLRDVVRVLEELAPTRHAASWDNVGLLVGDPDQGVTRILLAIDYTHEVAEEARRAACELVVAYHPPIFTPVKRLTAGSVVFEAIRRGVALYSPHTALDVAPGGTNDLLADAIGLVDRAPLRLAPPAEWGMGRVGTLPTPTPRPALLERVKQELAISSLLVAGPQTGTVTRAAVCAGACGDLIDDAIAREVDLYLTGEVRHHDALRAAAAGVTVVCVLHSNSERGVLGRLATRIEMSCPGVRVRRSQADRDPFCIL